MRPRSGGRFKKHALNDFYTARFQERSNCIGSVAVCENVKRSLSER